MSDQQITLTQQQWLSCLFLSAIFLHVSTCRNGWGEEVRLRAHLRRRDRGVTWPGWGSVDWKVEWMRGLLVVRCHVFVQTQCCSVLQCRWCHLHLLLAAPNAMHVHCRGRMGVERSGRGEGRRHERWAAKQNCDDTVMSVTSSHSPVHSLVTVRDSRCGHPHIFRADSDFKNMMGTTTAYKVMLNE